MFNSLFIIALLINKNVFFIVGIGVVGFTTIDYVLENLGYVEVFDGYFQNFTYKATGDKWVLQL